MLAADRFRFLNETHQLLPGAWDPDELEKLWRYNLHYFDDLNAAKANERLAWHQDLIHQWVDENPVGRGTGWEPYPTSLRIVNWIKWALAGNSLPPDCLQSLALQVRWLTKRLEYHILGNHLLANAKALVFAGSFFSGTEAQRWFSRGLDILDRELEEQILADGGHFERSTMYHVHTLEDILDLINLSLTYSRLFQPAAERMEAWQDIAVKMGKWLQVMTHEDGEISFFNDAALDIEPMQTQIYAYAERLGIKIPDLSKQSMHSLPQSGYIRIGMGDAVLIIDQAPLGADYLPGHGHADSLSFEASFYGKRVFVNSGTSCYGNSSERLRQRGTRAHNTVVIDSENSSEVWGGFRVARRARVETQDPSVAGEMITIEASHNGYRRLPGRNIHHRRWQLSPGRLMVEDEITGQFRQAEAIFHLHPEVDVEIVSEDKARLRLSRGTSMDLSVTGGSLNMESTTWHPGFGVSVPNLCIVVAFKQAKLSTSLVWQPA